MKASKVASNVVATSVPKLITKIGLVSSATSLLMALASPSILAQEIKSAIEANKQRTEVETIEVVGIRGSLESALNTKREASSIVDAISAADIGSLPALDLGEALQAVPGIQINRDGERRSSEINLRGLPGAFVKTTANNQSFSTPSRNAALIGNSNPFGSFDASVFDGVTVIKSPTAANQAGGIAGIVDKKLQKALSKQDGRYSVSLGTRYEESNNSFDKELKLSAAKHLIKDELAVALKLGYSDQHFRRDSLLFARYEELDSGIFNDYDNWKTQQVAQHGIPEDAAFYAAGSMQQLAEVSRGDKLSITGNVEWKVTDNLKLGMDVLYTKRDLTDGNFEQVSSEVQNRGAKRWLGQQIIPADTAVPFLRGYSAEGTPLYTVSETRLENATYVPANRIFNFFEESLGTFVNFEYLSDDWAIDGVVTHSESENLFEQTGFDFRLQGSTSKSVAPTGITTLLNTGKGNLNDVSISIDGWQDINYNQTWKEGNSLNLNVADTTDPKNLAFYVLGRHDNPKRDMQSGEINFKRFVDLPIAGDVLTINAFQFGGRYTSETLENQDFTPSSGGINVANINSDFLSSDILSDTDNLWFNGQIPNFAGSDAGWQTLKTDFIKAQLQEGLVVPEGATVIPSSGFIARTKANTNGVLDRWETNFTATEAITAAYGMADFEGEIAGLPYTGNAGVRYVLTQTEIEGSKQSFIDGTNQFEIFDDVTTTEYDHYLPSLNLAFELHDDVLLRTAFNKGFVRPNLRAQTPVTRISETENKIDIDSPKSAVAAYTAKSYDISLEWYNREGSAISIGVFKKEISGLFQSRNICPMPGEAGADAYFADTGALNRIDKSDGDFDCYQVDEYTKQDGTITNRNVDITINYNGDGTIKVTGYEAAIQQKLDFLPYPWNGFGGVLNYSYVENKESGGDGLVGISPNSYNAIAYYENDGFSFRLAYNYRDKYKLDGGASFGGPDQKNVKSRGQLDLSASYKLMKNLKVDLRGYNLTDENRYEYIGEDEGTVSKINYDGVTYAASVTYTF
ncbi:TonB-dependent receptor [Algibacillus agarilyticus]|uniref:TonB-dependent receptor n=1 Tax=Algibacillus agarilyticus TaxID=2234133 RepID=UPI000DCFD369|nr:TonB-dependent receptor [Algibacillus agarilyticus]